MSYNVLECLHAVMEKPYTPETVHITPLTDLVPVLRCYQCGALLYVMVPAGTKPPPKPEL